MLQRTFIHLPGVGFQKEKKFWVSGINNWNLFLQKNTIPGLSEQKKFLFDKIIIQGQRAVLEGNSSFFTCIKSTEQWRLWSEFKQEACFIDIETNYRNDITVLGISDGERTWQFVRDHNMDVRQIKDLLFRFKLIITFNGSSFDIPIIKKYFGNIIPDIPHIDLRFAAAKVGLKGGLKKIEQQLNISRPEDLEGMGGNDALKLWALYRSGAGNKYLKLLLDYNKEDILNLKPLADVVYRRLVQETLKEVNV